MPSICDIHLVRDALRFTASHTTSFIFMVSPHQAEEVQSGIHNRSIHSCDCDSAAHHCSLVTFPGIHQTAERHAALLGRDKASANMQKEWGAAPGIETPQCRHCLRRSLSLESSMSCSCLHCCGGSSVCQEGRQGAHKASRCLHAPAHRTSVDCPPVMLGCIQQAPHCAHAGAADLRHLTAHLEGCAQLINCSLQPPSRPAPLLAHERRPLARVGLARL